MAEMVTEYRVMTEADVKEVSRLMDDVFFHEEIISQSLEFDTPSETQAYYDNAMPACLMSGLSLVAIDRSDQRIVAAILNIITTRENPNEFKFNTEDDLTKKLATMDAVYDPVYEGIDFYKLYDTHELVANRGLCVAPSHSRCGVATALLRKSLELIRDKGYQCYVVEATSAYVRTMMDRLGFNNVIEKPYSELLVNGRQIVRDTSTHSSLSLHAIKV